jgi:hypothetical protein
LAAVNIRSICNMIRIPAVSAEITGGLSVTLAPLFCAREHRVRRGCSHLRLLELEDELVDFATQRLGEDGGASERPVQRALRDVDSTES